MALIERYFSTIAAGAADGTTWADRAALFSAGNWSTVITGFDFSGSNAMRARIGPGSYACAQSLTSGLFANAPTAPNPLLLHGCDSSGNLLEPPDPNWTSDLPEFSDADLPVIDITSNIFLCSLQHACWRLCKLTASSGRSGSLTNLFGSMDWCHVVNATANSSAMALNGGAGISNCYFACTGSSYNVVWLDPVAGAYNVRVTGVAGSSGNRRGVAQSNTTGSNDRITIAGVGGDGWIYTGTAIGVSQQLRQFTIVGCGGSGVVFPNTASQTARSYISRCMITGCVGYGINPGGANTHLVVTDTRLRDNTSGNFNTFGNYPQDLDVYTTDSDDATEYVDSGSGNYQIKSGAAIHGLGFGVSEECAGGGGGGRRRRLITVS